EVLMAYILSPLYLYTFIPLYLNASVPLYPCNHNLLNSPHGRNFVFTFCQSLICQCTLPVVRWFSAWSCIFTSQMTTTESFVLSGSIISACIHSRVKEKVAFPSDLPW